MLKSQKKFARMDSRSRSDSKGRGPRKSLYEQAMEDKYRKEKWRNDIMQQREEVQEAQAARKFMNKKSQRIWEKSAGGRSSVQSMNSDASGVSSGAGTPTAKQQVPGGYRPQLRERNPSVASNSSAGKKEVASFLSRNFYAISKRKQETEQRAKQKYDAHQYEKRTKEYEQWRTITPGKFSQARPSSNLSSTSSQASRTRQQPFKPNLNHNSQRLSQKSKKSSEVFSTLHSQSQTKLT